MSWDRGPPAGIGPEANKKEMTMPRGYLGVTDLKSAKTVKRTPRGTFVEGGKGGPGRPKGLPNKFTGDLKEAFLQAAQAAGGEDGVAGYPYDQAMKDNPSPFMSGLARLIPMASEGKVDATITVRIVDDTGEAAEDGVNAGRKTIPFARFDKTRCAQGLEALRSYRTKWDEKARAFKKTPDHNWASHGADAWRYLSLSWHAPMREAEPEKRPAGIPLPDLTWDQFFDIEDGPLSREERV
jgi:hypothetical protein